MERKRRTTMTGTARKERSERHIGSSILSHLGVAVTPSLDVHALSKVPFPLSEEW